MNNKKWLISLFSFIIIFVFLIEAFYTIYQYNRHQVDYLVKTKIPNLSNQKYETLILGDSLARNAFSKLTLHKDILDLTSNNAVSLAGNYFILKRYLSQNNAPKNLYLFCIPDHLYQNLNTIHTFSYFESIFNKKSEIKEIKNIKPNLYNTQFSFDKYTESRLKALNIYRHFSPVNRSIPVTISEQILSSLKRSNFTNTNISKQITSAKNNKNKINGIPRIYINKIKDLCDQLGIKLTIVIEPLPLEINNTFKHSKMYKYILDKNIRLLNINDHYTFNNHFFKRDGVHIEGNVNHYYQNLIDKNILDIY